MSSFPAIKCEVAFAAGASVDPSAGQWIDISPYLRSFSTKRGRNRDLDQIEAGTATIVLRNDDRRFDPENTSSPYYPNVLPMRHIRLRAVYSSVTYDLWRGFVDGWPQSWPGRPIPNQGPAEVTVTATDAFKIFNNIALPASLWEIEVRAASPKAWWRLGEPERSTIVRDSGPSNFDSTVVGTPEFGQDGILLSSDTGVSFSDPGDVIFANPAAIPTGNNWTIEALVRRPTEGDTPRSYNFDTEVIVTVYDGSLGAANFMSLDFHYEEPFKGRLRTAARVAGGSNVIAVMPVGTTLWDGKDHHVMAQRSWNGVSGTLTLNVDGIQVASAAWNSSSVPDAPWSVFAIGRSPNVTTSSNFRGVLHELVFYDSSTPSAATHAGWALTPFKGMRTDQAITRILDAIAWPAGLRILAAGSSTLQASGLDGTVLEFLQNVALTENGFLFVDPAGVLRFQDRHATQVAPGNVSQATFGDDTNELPYADLTFEYDDALIHNEARVGRAGSSPILVSDATSIATYQRRTFDRTDLMTESDLEVADYGNWIVNRRKDARTEVRSMVIRPESRSTLWTQVLTREIGDLVTVKRRPPGGGAVISKNVRIEGVEHNVTNNRKWTTTYWLSGWNPQDQSWILGDATYGVLGSTTRAGF